MADQLWFMTHIREYENNDDNNDNNNNNTLVELTWTSYNIP